MTDWERVEKLRSSGATWKQVARDRKVGFHAPEPADPAHTLKTLYFQRRSRAARKVDSPTIKPDRAPGAPSARRRLVLLALLVAAIIVVVYVIDLGPHNASRPAGWVGRSAPDFTLARANAPGSFTLSAEAGQTNVLLFFNEGLSCSPCLVQMEQLDADAAQFQTLHVLVVSITGDSLSSMETWSANSQATHTVVLADPTLAVSNTYDTTSAAVSMMPGSAPGHTFILVDAHGVVQWRADYGPSDMSVPESEILQAVQHALNG